MATLGVSLPYYHCLSPTTHLLPLRAPRRLPSQAHGCSPVCASPPLTSPASSSSDPDDKFVHTSEDDGPGRTSHHRRQPGCTVVEEFYAGINRRDLDSLRDLIAEDCIYEDLVFPQPFVGRKAILEFFSKFTGVVGSDLQFAIDDISREDPLCVGVTWHLEWRGKPFPFSKGCGFYRLSTSNGKQQIMQHVDSHLSLQLAYHDVLKSIARSCTCLPLVNSHVDGIEQTSLSDCLVQWMLANLMLCQIVNL